MSGVSRDSWGVSASSGVSGIRWAPVVYEQTDSTEYLVIEHTYKKKLYKGEGRHHGSSLSSQHVITRQISDQRNDSEPSWLMLESHLFVPTEDYPNFFATQLRGEASNDAGIDHACLLTCRLTQPPCTQTAFCDSPHLNGDLDLLARCPHAHAASPGGESNLDGCAAGRHGAARGCHC